MNEKNSKFRNEKRHISWFGLIFMRTFYRHEKFNFQTEKEITRWLHKFEEFFRNLFNSMKLCSQNIVFRRGLTRMHFSTEFHCSTADVTLEY